jgi:hypothetical protein
MNPVILQVLLTSTPEIIAKVIALLKILRHDNEAEQLSLVLRRADANADQLIANAQAALDGLAIP